MKERPILFSGEMVRAILDGRKTMTRRILKPQPSEGWTPNGLGEVHKMKDGEFILRDGLPIVAGWGACNADGDEAYVCPYGQPGDRLWVRETWGDVTLAFQSHENEEPKVLAFRADEGVYNAHSMKRLEKNERQRHRCAEMEASNFSTTPILAHHA